MATDTGNRGTRGSKANSQREKILRVAVRLFAQRGYHATTLKQLANQAGMTAPNLYNYYRSKEEILFEVHNSQLTRLLSELRELSATEKDVAARIYAFAYGMTHRNLEDPVASFVPSNRLIGLRGNKAKMIRELMRDIRREWVRSIEEGVRDGIFEVKEPKLAALNGLTMCSYVATWFDPKGAYSKEQVAGEAADSCLRMVGYRNGDGM